MKLNYYKSKLKEELYLSSDREEHIKEIAEEISEELLQGHTLTQNDLFVRMTGVEFCEEVINATIAMVHRIVMRKGKCLVSVPVIDIKQSNTMNVVISDYKYKAVNPVVTSHEFFEEHLRALLTKSGRK